jgi:hypothetical protein
VPKGTTPQTEPETALAVVAGGPLAEVAEVLASIPEVDVDPTERMAAFILNAPPEEWESLWDKLPNLKDNPGRKFRLHDLRIRDSDFKGRFNKYLICDVTWLDTGETGLLSNSSEIGMVQMLALFRDGKLPADLEIVQKDKPTKAGFRPIHLRYLNRAQIPAGDPTQVVSEQ